MPYRAGELDQRVVLKRQINTPDNMGGNVHTWTPIATVWAKVRPMTGREREHSDRLNAEANYIIVIRSRTDIDETTIATWNGTDFNLTFVKQEPRSRFLVIEASKGVPV